MSLERLSRHYHLNDKKAPSTTRLLVLGDKQTSNLISFVYKKIKPNLH